MTFLPKNLTLNLETINRESDLEQFFPIEAFIHETAKQIIKDFSEFDIEIRFSGDTKNAYAELFNQMEFEIEKVLNRDFNKLLNLLYRIDVNENEIAKREHLNPDASLAALVSDVIIRRELKKVLLRYYFKYMDGSSKS